MPSDNVAVMVRVPRDVITDVESLISQGRYKNRADFFLTGGRFLLREEQENNKNSVGAET